MKSYVSPPWPGEFPYNYYGELILITDKYFHFHPELSFLEKDTAAKIVEHLRSLGAYEIFPNIGGKPLTILFVI